MGQEMFKLVRRVQTCRHKQCGAAKFLYSLLTESRGYQRRKRCPANEAGVANTGFHKSPFHTYPTSAKHPPLRIGRKPTFNVHTKQFLGHAGCLIEV